MTSGKRKYIWIFSIVALLVLIVGYRYSSKRIELFGHYEKVWAHRVNDLPKLESAQNSFAGIELDLTYLPQKNKLAVYHAGISTADDLYFEEYIEHIDNKNLGLWLDIKNLNRKNVLDVFQQVENAVNSSFYKDNKDKILVESNKPNLLNPFLKFGYRASFYLPQNLPQNTKPLQGLIQESLQKNKGMELSGYYKTYPFLKEHFPEAPKNLWILTSTYDPETIKNYDLIRGLLNDSTVKNVLIPYINFNRHFAGE
jgi:hypothetical protein